MERQETNTSEILKAILDNSPESIVLISPEHKVLAFNKVIQQTLKLYFENELQLGDDYRDFVASDSKELYLQSFAKAIQGEMVLVEHETKSINTSIWFEYKLNPVYSSSGKLMGITLTAKNIDKEKRAQIELENMAENYEAIIENVNESIILLDKNYKVLRFNKLAQTKLFKNNRRIIQIGDDFRDYVVYPNALDIFYKSFSKAIDGIITSEEMHFTNIYQTDIWILAKIFPVYKRNGDLLGVSIFGLNIEERKQAEIDLKESEEKFKRILESAPTPILVVDQKMKIRLANTETEAVFGYAPDELINQSIKKLIPEGLEYENQETLKLEEIPISYNRGPNTFTYGFKKNGQKIYIQARLNKFQVKNEPLALVVLEDITEQIKAEQKIVNQLKRLEAIAWQQSHEVRRPVASILGIINLLKSIPNLTEQERILFLDNLFKVTEELDGVIRKIVEYTYDPET